jgi:hypothetical protein
MKLFAAVLLLIIALTLAAAPAPARQDKAEAGGEALLKIPVWVETEEGGFWDEGRRQAFTVFLEDQEVPIRSFQSPRSSTIILVIFDTVSDLARVDEARSALRDAIQPLSNQYWIGLLRAQDGLSVLQEPTADRALLLDKIQSIQVSGKAGLLDTLEPVSRLATSILHKAGVRLSVLYISDGGIGHYRADYLNPVINSSDSGDLSRRFSDRAVQERVSRLAESLAVFTVPLFVLHLEHRGDALNLAYQSGLERIAAASGGAAIFCRTSDEIRPSLANLIARIRASYVLAVEAPDTKRQAVKVRVAVREPGGKTLNRVTHASQIHLRKR